MVEARVRTLFALTLLVGVISLGARCGGGLPSIKITNPATESVFSNASSIQIDGKLLNVALGGVADVRVNGVSVLPLGAGNSFSAVVSLDPIEIFNPIVAELEFTNGKKIRDRVTVVAGDGLAGPGGTGFVLDGDFSPEGVGLRLNDSGLDQLEPQITGLVNIDLGAMMPYWTYITSISLLWNFDIYVDNPPPGYSGFSIDIDSQTNLVDGLIDLNNLRVDLFLDGTGILAPDCGARIETSLLEIDGQYALDPDAIDPTNIDVSQIGNVTFGDTQFSIDITWGFWCQVAEFFGLIGDVNQEIESGLSTMLNAVDGNGNTPVAAAVETALADIEIAGPIGESLGLSLETPLFDVLEDVDGITLDSDARITSTVPDPDAPDLDASYHVNEAFPTFGALSTGGLPYGLGIAISTSGFNQLLKAEVESGLLRLVGPDAITEFDLDGPGGADPVPLSALVMTIFVPEFAGYPAGKLFKIEISPRMAPIMTGAAGPLGEMAELRIAHLLFEIRDLAANQLYLQAAVDVKLGTDLNFVAGALEFALGTAQANDISVDVLRNNVNTNEISLEQVLQFLLPTVLPTLGDSLGTFPLPEFLGMSLQAVEVGKSGQFLTLFLDLVPVP